MQGIETDELTALIDTAWLKVAKGTWSKSDKRIFAMGWREGYMERGRQIKKAMESNGHQQSREAESTR